MGNTVYEPGDVVPSDGIYNVIHHKHRLLHGATLTKGMFFPQCRKCHLNVRFVLIRAIKGGIIPFRSGEILHECTEPRHSVRAAKA